MAATNNVAQGTTFTGRPKALWSLVGIKEPTKRALKLLLKLLLELFGAFWSLLD